LLAGPQGRSGVSRRDRPGADPRRLGRRPPPPDPRVRLRPPAGHAARRGRQLIQAHRAPAERSLLMTNATTPATVKDAAAAIRADLKAAFPDTRFSVRKGDGTASAWVDVTWTDGPNDDMVRNITDRYEQFGSPVEGVCRDRLVS